MYVYNINAILFRYLKSETGNEHLDTFTYLHQILITCGIQPQYVRMDNEYPDVAKKYIRQKEMDLQLTPPQMHCLNLAEQTIQTAKSPLIAGPVGVNPKFTLRLWCQLVQQCEKTSNMMPPTHINPKISADKYLHGMHNLNQVHMAPSNTLAMIYMCRSNM